MKLPRWAFAVLILLVVGGCLAVGGWFWKRAALENRVRETMVDARSLLEAGEGRDAWMLMQSTRAPDKDSELAGEWFDLQIDLAAETRQFERLRRFENQDPGRFAQHEAAVNWLQRLAYLKGAAPAEVVEGAPVDPILEADLALREGDSERAEAILREGDFSDEQQVNRLERQALLAGEDRESAWEFLSQAYSVDPRNSEIRTFSGNLLEEGGIAELARREYVAALLLAPRNPRMRDNLAEFYLRQGNVPLAVETWLQAPGTPENAQLILKAWFWNRVVMGNHSLDEPGRGGTLVERLAGMPSERFWDPSLDAAVDADPSLAAREEIFWLRLLERLREGDDSLAWQLLVGADPGQTQHHPALKESLLAVLGARTGRAKAIDLEIPPERQAGHPFWEWLAEHKGERRRGERTVGDTHFADREWLAAGRRGALSRRAAGRSAVLGALHLS